MGNKLMSNAREIKVNFNLILITLFIGLFVFLSSFASAGELKVTEEHPFLVNGEWISASELKVGDLLQTADGKKVRITEIEDIIDNNSFPVYNLEAGRYHNFVVDSGDGLEVVVHNSNKVGEVLQKAVPDEKKILGSALDTAARGQVLNRAQVNNLENFIGKVYSKETGSAIGINNYLRNTPNAKLYFTPDGKMNVQSFQDPSVLKSFVDDVENYIRSEGINNFVREGDTLVFVPSRENIIGRIAKDNRITFNPKEELINGVYIHEDKTIYLGIGALTSPEESAIARYLMHEKIHTVHIQNIENGVNDIFNIRIESPAPGLGIYGEEGFYLSESNAYIESLKPVINQNKKMANDILRGSANSETVNAINQNVKSIRTDVGVNENNVLAYMDRFAKKTANMVDESTSVLENLGSPKMEISETAITLRSTNNPNQVVVITQASDGPMVIKIETGEYARGKKEILEIPVFDQELTRMFYSDNPDVIPRAVSLATDQLSKAGEMARSQISIIREINAANYAAEHIIIKNGGVTDIRLIDTTLAPAGKDLAEQVYRAALFTKKLEEITRSKIPNIPR